MPVPRHLMPVAAAVCAGGLGLTGLALASGPPAAGGQATASAAAKRTTRLHLSASKTKFRFSVKRLNAKAGKVIITMSNPSGLPHAIAVEGHGVDKDGRRVTRGGTSTVRLTLKRGTYTFYCPVDGHRKAGMQGRLVVR